ncbi:MAG: hemerythrin domain-containing protein [Chitinophagales bacterium]|nr:hemerythrin domain-containing protein [Chitinophagales bacterium]
MERLKSLDPPHKGLRNALSKLAFIAGKTEYTSISSVEKLQFVAKEVFHLLKDHTATENKFILAPLEKVNPGFTNDYYAHHLEIDNTEQALLDRIMALNGQQTNEEGHQLYLDICEFQSHYLEHINEEDSVLEAEMQKHFTDEELMQHQIAIMGEMSFDTLLLWFKYIVPARRPAENAQVLTGFKSAVPEVAFITVIEIIKNEISDNELQEILSMIK